MHLIIFNLKQTNCYPVSVKCTILQINRHLPIPLRETIPKAPKNHQHRALFGACLKP